MYLQVEGYNTSYQQKLRPEPKDHIKENVRRMRQIQRASRQREETKQAPVKVMWKTAKFEGVQSKVLENLKSEPAAPRPNSSNYLRAHSRTGHAPLLHRPPSTEPPEEKLSVPAASVAGTVKIKRNNVDFVKLNGMSAKHSAMRRSPSLTALDDLKKKQEEEVINYQKGEVPRYLQDRKGQWEREEMERQASIPDPDLPPGHRLMPQKERLATLEKLRATETELLHQLNSMPIRSDTPRVRSRKDEINNKLAEIDEAIKIFSRSKVFVRMDT